MTAIEVDNLCYLLDENEKTASVTTSPLAKGDIIIPRVIINNSNEYIITSVLESAFRNLNTITSVQFAPNSEVRMIGKNAFRSSKVTKVTLPPHLTTICEKTFSFCGNLNDLEIPADSELKTIENEAFNCTKIESLTFPSTLCELKTGWCIGTVIKNVKIDSRNQIFQMMQNQFILTKTSPEKVDFDALVFAVRDIEIARIPDSIETILPYAFIECESLSKVFINTSSKLRNIGDFAFSECPIESIWIPPSLRRIGMLCFHDSMLTNIEIPSNSELRTIESDAFYNSPIESIYIPSKLVELVDGWCNRTTELDSFKVSSDNLMYKDYDGQMIIGKSSIEKKIFDVLVFVKRNAKKVTIPSIIEIIAKNALEFCHSLSSFIIPKDSNLRVIDSYAFAFSAIEYLKLPSHLTHICEYAFQYCK